jgi:hypothetical protein
MKDNTSTYEIWDFHGDEIWNVVFWFVYLESVGYRFIQNVGNYQQGYKSSQPRRPKPAKLGLQS